MQEHLQDAEIGIAQFRPFDALRGVRDQRLKGFHEDEPNMHAGGFLPVFNFGFPLHSII